MDAGGQFMDAALRDTAQGHVGERGPRALDPRGLERGDYSSAEWAHPEVEYVIADGPTPGSWTGLASLAEGWREYPSTWDDYRIEVDACRELDDERVLVLTRVGGRGTTSGLQFEQMAAGPVGLFHIRDGKVIRMVQYFDRALADLGLEE